MMESSLASRSGAVAVGAPTARIAWWSRADDGRVAAWRVTSGGVAEGGTSGLISAVGSCLAGRSTSDTGQ